MDDRRGEGGRGGSGGGLRGCWCRGGGRGRRRAALAGAAAARSLRRGRFGAASSFPLRGEGLLRAGVGWGGGGGWLVAVGLPQAVWAFCQAGLPLGDP